MSSTSDSHPNKNQLIAFGQGKLAVEESVCVERHLESCPACCETLLDLKDDTFVGLVRIAQQPVSVADAASVGEQPAVTNLTEPDGQMAQSAAKDLADAGRVSHGSEHSATILVSETELNLNDELPVELRDHPRYRIAGLLGRGGMGSVYRAEHRLMNRPVAIKLINSQLVRNPQAVERFRREVQAAAKLSHPNIVAAYDAEQAGRVHFLVMEFVEGTDLATVVDHRGPLPISEACRYIQQAAEGLQHAHEKGMVHRDIKPHNLMLSSEGQVRILDFGLAGFAAQDVTDPVADPASVRDSRSSEPSRTGAASSTQSLTSSSLSSPVDSQTIIAASDAGITNDHENPGRTVNMPTDAGEFGSGFAQTGMDRDSNHESTKPSLADAGSVRHGGGNLTTMGSVMGTPDYMAPEQAADAHSADIRADIYSLGCTLHFLLTGQPPFTADNVLAKLKSHAQAPRPDLKKLRADVPPELAAIAARMMAQKTSDRYQSPSEVVAALAPFANPTAERPRSKTRVLVAAALIVILLLAGVIVVTTAKGRIEITSDVDDVEIVVSQSGQELRTIDLKTGTKVAWLPSGDYSISLRHDRNDVKLEPNGFQLSRWGKEVVRVRLLTGDDLPDQDRLQGRWIASSVKVGNGPIPKGAVSQWSMTFAGQNLRVTTPTNSEAGTFRLDVTKNPKEIDVEPTNGQGRLRGIYRFVDGELEVCFDDSNRPRPVQWDVDIGTHQLLLRLRMSKGNSPTAQNATASKQRPQPAVAPYDAKQAAKHQAAWAEYLGLPIEFTNSIGMRFRLIPPGEFVMGSTPQEIEEGIKVAGSEQTWQAFIRSETPQHTVKLTQPFYLGAHELTQEQYQKTLGRNPSDLSPTGRRKDEVEGRDTNRFPVEMITWTDAAEFCARLSQHEQLKPCYVRNNQTIVRQEGDGYRLPTEAQWEFACRAGTTTRFWNGDNNADLTQVAWMSNRHDYRNNTVGELRPNPFGLFDVHGNVWEWTQDEWGPAYYQQFENQPATDPTGPQTASPQYVIRGGVWAQDALSARSAFRFAYPPSHRWGAIGLRASLPAESVRRLINQAVIPTSPEIAPQKQVAAANQFVRDQLAAEWILRIGATLRINVEGAERLVTKREELPDGDWQITEISIYPVRLQPSARLDKLAGLKALRWLRLFGTGITDEGIKHLTDVPKLLYIDLDYNQVTTDATLEHLAQNIPFLTAIGLHGTSIKDAGIQHLAKLKNLEAINLTDTKVGSSGVTHLAGMPALKWLTLNGTQIDDAGLASLAGCPSLDTLELARTAISDGAVEHLIKLKGLKRLALRETKVTSAGLEKLRQGLPNTTIEAFTPEQQQALWRQLADSVAWSVLKPIAQTSNGGATIWQMEDGSLFVQGANPAQAVYSITAQSALKRITALRLDVLLDDRLPNRGPGRSGNGTFVLTGVEVGFRPAANAPIRSIKLRQAVADFVQDSHDVSRIPEGRGSWAIWRGGGPLQNQSMVLDLSEELVLQEGSEIFVTLRHESIWEGAGLGRFKLSATDAAQKQVQQPAPPSVKRSPLDLLRDQAAVMGYLNNPRNNTGGSVPVALIGQNGRVAFRFGMWLIVFDGLACDPNAGILGFSAFNVPQKGTGGEGTIDFGAGTKLPGVLIKYKFDGDKNDISVNSHRFAMRGRATRLEFPDKAYDATTRIQTIHVERDGSTRLEPGNVTATATNSIPVSVGVNLVDDPSLEKTAVGQRYPTTWGTGNISPANAYKHQVVAGGRTGMHGWQIEGNGQFAVVPSNRPPANPAYRYAARSWVKLESGAAQIKLLYFDARGNYLGENRGTFSSQQDGWQQLTMIDQLAQYPEARSLSLALTLIGTGKAVFDDLELIAFDATKLPQDFESTYGGLDTTQNAVFDRWAGQWATSIEFKPTVENADGGTNKGVTQISQILNKHFLLTYFKGEQSPLQYVNLLTLDQNLGVYRIWVFGSRGEAYERRGQWNSASQTLTLQLVPPVKGITGESTDRFIGQDRFESSIFVKGSDGQVTRDIRSTSRRTGKEATSDIESSQPPKTTDEESQLQKFVGEWTILARNKPSVWNPEASEATQTEKVDWILDGRFLLARTSNDKGELTSVWIAHYEPTEKSNRFWFFNADGSSGQWRVTWDASSRGFHWRSIDMPTGWIGTGFNRWIDDDTFDNQTLIKDEQGRVLLDGTQEKRRKK